MSEGRESPDRSFAGPLGALPVPYGRGIFNFHWYNFHNAVAFQIILGAPTVLLAKDLGANSLILGLIAAFTPLLTILQLPAARHLAGHSYRSFALMGWTARTFCIAVAAMVPILLFLPRETRLILLLAALFFFNVLRGISTAAFMPWITSIVESRDRGRFIAVDHTFINAGSLVAMLFSGFLMRGYPGPGRYSLVLWGSVATALASLLCIRRIPDARQRQGEEGSSALARLSEMASLPQFRNWIGFNLLFATVAGGLGVFPVEYLKDQARFDPSLIYLLAAGTFLGPMLILRKVGLAVDRCGSIAVIRISILLFAIVLLSWFLLSSGVIRPGWEMVLLLNVVGGMAMAAFNMGNGHLWMGVVPEKGKNHYFAVATVITSAAVGVVPILWGWILEALGGLDLAEGPFHIRRHSIYFLGITLLSVAALFFSGILIDPGNKDSKSPAF